MVQRGKGLRFHRRRRGPGRLRALQQHYGHRVPHAGGRAAGRVRNRAGHEGTQATNVRVINGATEPTTTTAPTTTTTTTTAPTTTTTTPTTTTTTAPTTTTGTTTVPLLLRLQSRQRGPLLHHRCCRARQRRGQRRLPQRGRRLQGVLGRRHGTTPLLRAFSPATGDHFYTTSVAERDNAVANVGYVNEGVACHVFSAAGGHHAAAAGVQPRHRGPLLHHLGGRARQRRSQRLPQ